jgi:two-component system cell cycle sensor histidine kinase/response regulator CckA
MSGVDVLTGQTRALYRHTGGALLVDGVCAAIASAGIWRSVAPRWLGGWLLAMAAIAVARFRLARRYEAEASLTSSDAGAARRWATRFAVGSAASGVGWGGAAFAFSEHATFEERLFGALLFAALCSLAVSMAPLSLLAFVAFVAPALAGLALGVALPEHLAQPELAAAIGLYGVGLIVIARVNQRALQQAPAPRATDAEAPPRLTRSSFAPQPNLQELNRSLEQRLAERGEALRKQSQALRDAQRLEALGRLAGGVAHDFNNLLTIILADISELLSDGAQDARTRETLREVRDAAAKGAALVRQLLTFSPRTRTTPEMIDLTRTLGNMERMLGRMLGAGITLELALEQGPVNVLIDPTRMEQVIVNLVTNARDAMRAGVVSVRIEVMDLHAATGALEPGRYATLSVSDTGIGMDAETRRRMFEPFFTTKEPGKGTGLGLPTAYVVVQQAGGDIEVSSEPGNGSCFRVWLPLAETTRERALTPVKGRNLSGFHQIQGAPHHATVLLVEDDPTLRSVTRRILESAGHTVLTSPSGERALEIAAEHSGPIELLITDVVMMGMDGLTLATVLRSQRTELRTLFVSGYGRDQVLPADMAPTEFLPKPFTHDALLDRVHDLLSTSDPSRRAAAPKA